MFVADNKQGHRMVPVPDLDVEEANVTFDDDDDWQM
jgi:hypothetical protein